MFNHRYFGTRYFGDRYWPKHGADVGPTYTPWKVDEATWFAPGAVESNWFGPGAVESNWFGPGAVEHNVISS